MRHNLVSPRARLRAGAPMQDHDRLPAALRAWAAQAALPWSAASLRRIWQRAIGETGCDAQAIARLNAAETAALAREAARVWGGGHPAARSRGDDRTGADQVRSDQAGALAKRR